MKLKLPKQLYQFSFMMPIVLFTTLFVLNFVVYYFEQKKAYLSAVEIAKTRLSDTTNMAQYLIEYSQRNGLLDLTHNTLSNLTSNQYITSAALVSPDNKIIASSQLELIGATLSEILKTLDQPPDFSDQVTQQLSSARKNRQSSFQVSTDKRTAIFLSAVKISPDQTGALIINYDLAASTAAEHQHAEFWVLLYAIVFVIVYIVLTFGFHRVISMRTERILTAIKLYMSGNRRIKIEVSGTDEIGMLSSCIQELFNRVSSSEELLIAKTQELEKLNILLTNAKDVAEKSSKAKSEFLANMSHEIRTPMSVILGSADMLIESRLDEKTQARYLSILKKSGDTLLSLINDILDVSRIEAGVLNLSKERFNLGLVLSEVIELNSMGANKKNLQLKFSIDPNLNLEYIGDANRVKQVLNNLISNAIKYTENGSIFVSLKHNPNKDTPGELLFEIEDSGIGIPESFRNKIFSNFTQGDISTTKKYGGVGLGLSISKHLAEKMGGQIRYESTPQIGSRFFFTLKLQPDLQMPALTTTVEQDKTKPPLYTAPTSYDKYRVLIVEDTEDVRALLKALIQSNYIDISECENGLQAIEMVKKYQFDLIFMDIQMPIMDGYTALKHIREWETDEQHEHHTIVALTAYAMKDDREKCLNAGFDFYMSKPVKRQELREFISKMQAAKDNVIKSPTP